MKDGLIAMGAENLGGAEGGFVYAKVPVRMKQAAIKERILQVRRLVDQAGVEIAIIDLDSSPESGQSEFYNLWTAAAD